jgi:hypothetical protein
MNRRISKRNLAETMSSLPKEEATCPKVKGWRENAFSEWVASHRTEVRSLICNAPKYTEASFCKRGRRSS